LILELEYILVVGSVLASEVDSPTWPGSGALLSRHTHVVFAISILFVFFLPLYVRDFYSVCLFSASLFSMVPSNIFSTRCDFDLPNII
jgi:hypothetical protein